MNKAAQLKEAVSLQKLNKEFTQKNDTELSGLDALYAEFQRTLPELGEQWNGHSTTFLTRQTLSRLFYYQELYQHIIDVPGVIMEFGVQWGSTLTTLQSLRGMYEPYNHSRKILGFDTFEGFVNINDKDGGYSDIGDYAVGDNYAERLDNVLKLHEEMSPLPHIKKYDLIQGDVCKTVPKWLDANPYAIVSMAIFDVDVYEPTKIALESVLPRLTKGSVLVFDEINCQHFPGETLALQEVLKSNNIRLRRHPHQTFCAYAIWGE